MNAHSEPKAVEPANEPQPRFLLTVRKWDVIDTLRRQHSLQTMVQILTPATGSDMHGRPELAQFMSATTLMYASDLARDQIEAARSLPTLDELMAAHLANSLKTELVFIDCWHSYDDSVQVLELALSMLPHGGFIVMHDCDPPDLEAAGPPPANCGELWCGDTWRAFVDFTTSLPSGCEWFVVESDFGVGVIRVMAPKRSRGRLRTKRVQPLARLAPEGYEAGWNWFVENRDAVLHPMSIADWQRRANDSTGVFVHYNR